MARFVEGGAAGASLTMILRSLGADPAKALISMRARGARPVRARVILAQLAPEDDLRQLFAACRGFARRASADELIRWARNPRLLDAHEQVTYGDAMCWSGTPAPRCRQRNGSTHSTRAPKAARHGRLAFEALWAASSLVPERRLLGPSTARPWGPISPRPTQGWACAAPPEPCGWPSSATKLFHDRLGSEARAEGACVWRSFPRGQYRPTGPLCFVLMPFGTKTDAAGRVTNFDKVYQNIIVPAVMQAGLEPVRADEEKIGGTIHKPMFERLMLCHYAVADITGANPNVFYELGIRHALRPRSTAIIFVEGTVIPFDIALRARDCLPNRWQGRAVDTAGCRSKRSDPAARSARQSARRQPDVPAASTICRAGRSITARPMSFARASTIRKDTRIGSSAAVREGARGRAEDRV